MPKISIIIPVFNAESFLSQCVESLIKQTLNDIEIILIDDKSTDLSLEIMQKFALCDSRIRIIMHEKNLGTFLARKSGIKEAKGEFIIFVDADDTLSLNACEILYKKAIESNADMVHFNVVFAPPQSHIVTKPKIYTQTLQDDEILGEIFVRDFKQSFLTLWMRLYSTHLVKAAISKLDFIDSHLTSSEDSALFLPLCALAKKSIGTNEAIYFYTQNPNSLLKSKNPHIIFKQIADRAFLRDKLPILKQDKDLAQNKYFKKSLQNCCDLMDYFICYSSRFLSKNDARTCVSPYIKYSILSFKYVARWQIAVKLVIFCLTFGRKKL